MHSVFLMILMHVHPFENWIYLFLIALALSCIAAFLTWRFIEAPALRYKALPAQIAKSALLKISTMAPSRS